MARKSTFLCNSKQFSCFELGVGDRLHKCSHIRGFLTYLGQEDVLRLEVPVEDVLLVDEVQRQHDLGCNSIDILWKPKTLP